MFKAVVDSEQKIVAVTNYNTVDPETLLYRNAELKFFYPEQIIEIHTEGRFVGILPLGATYVVFE